MNPVVLLALLSTLYVQADGSVGPVGPWASSVPASRLVDVQRKGKASFSTSVTDTKAGVAIFNHDHHDNAIALPFLHARGGQTSGSPNFVNAVNTGTKIIIACGKVVLPPVVACVRIVVGIYRSLPVDTIALQVGLVYCFAGGYYPALFSALQAAQHFGFQTTVCAIGDLTGEAIRVIEATNKESPYSNATRIQMFRKSTSVLMATVDPWKINQAAGALYTTWLGVSTVLEREYVRVITLSMTMAGFIERACQLILAPPAYICVEEKYHQWVPVVIGWGCKGLAINIAWRLQRVLTAGTSAMAGGLMFSRALLRILSKRGVRLYGLVRMDDEESQLDDAIGILVGVLGFCTQIKSQYKSGFSFKIPFPLNLVTWPFDWSERWIQWQISG